MNTKNLLDSNYGPTPLDVKRKAEREARAARLAQFAAAHPEQPTGRGEIRRQWRTWKRDERSKGNPHTWFRAFAASKAVES